MEKKKALPEFIEVYDTVGELGWDLLDLAQNLLFKFEVAKPEYNKIEENDVRLAYAFVNSGLMMKVHALAEALNYTREDYIDGADKRRGRGNVNIYVAGKGSINCNISDLVEGLKDETTKS